MVRPLARPLDLMDEQNSPLLIVASHVESSVLHLPKLTVSNTMPEQTPVWNLWYERTAYVRLVRCPRGRYNRLPTIEKMQVLRARIRKLRAPQSQQASTSGQDCATRVNPAVGYFRPGT